MKKGNEFDGMMSLPSNIVKIENKFIGVTHLQVYSIYLANLQHMGKQVVIFKFPLIIYSH